MFSGFLIENKFVVCWKLNNNKVKNKEVIMMYIFSCNGKMAKSSANIILVNSIIYKLDEKSIQWQVIR